MIVFAVLKPSNPYRCKRIGFYVFIMIGYDLLESLEMPILC